MTVTVKNKSALTVPTEVQRQAGIKIGDRLEFRVSGGIITILPDLPTADDEYTPEQRKILDAQLAEGLDDIRKGRVSPKFDTVDEMLASLKTPTSPRQKKTRGR
jgi:bifunctional DNA-binding transcriptional regulator/antitoxin component of YhaV-PrlF toxin-antitoxin module